MPGEPTSLRDRVLRWFEVVITGTLMVLLGVMVVLGTVSLVLLMVRNGAARFHEVGDAEALQTIMQRGFGGVLGVVLGLELMETLKQYTAEHHVRVEIVFMVGLIAVARHVIQIDYSHAPLGELVGLAAVILSLATGYFLVRRGSGAPEKRGGD
jgi:uncharacterized membrane protein (DUF373 family)